MVIKEAVGIIETLGLTAAIESADAMVKAANVKLIGYELTKGYGWVTVKISGDVGAVNAAIAAGSSAASKVNKVISTLVLPRPHADLDGIINSPYNVCNRQKNIEESDDSLEDESFETTEQSEETKTEENINLENNEKISSEFSLSAEETDEKEKKEEKKLSNNIEGIEYLENLTVKEKDIEENTVESEKSDVQILGDDTQSHSKPKNKICNLCGDEFCPREKGQPHDKCIHIDDFKKEV